jgi:hypothetical protein
MKHPGVAVVDVRDPKAPAAATFLVEPSMLDPWESLKVNEARKLLGAVQGDVTAGKQPGFAVYDISDCAKPVLKASLNLPIDVKGHAGDFAPDGRTYYGSQTVPPGVIYPIDITDPAKPAPLLKWSPGPDRLGAVHDITIRPDGRRLYGAQLGGRPPEGSTEPPRGGLVILDTSDVQDRKADPQIRVVGKVLWRDGGYAQVGKYIKIGGKPFVLFTDESGSALFNRAAACAQDLPPFGFARLIDIADDTNPKIVSKLMLAVHDPANCSKVLQDSPSQGFIYDSHYCAVDNPEDAKLAACSYFQSGIRVFDIRDPYHPREVAYYKPRVPTEAKPGAFIGGYTPRTEMVDNASANSRFASSKSAMNCSSG